jgi:hypothetical protein
MQHPLRQGLAVTMTPAGACGGPRCYGAEQNSSRDRKGEDNGASPGSCDGRSGVSDDAVDPTFCVRRGKAGQSDDLLDEISPVFRTHAAMTRGGKKDATGFGALVA